MNIKVGNYAIQSDSMQFVVKERKIVQEGEKKGEEYFTNKAYCCKFEQALSFIPQDIVKSNDDINIIMDKLTEVQKEINRLEFRPVIVIKEEKKFKFKDLKDGEIKEIEAEDEEKAWVELLGYHVCKYSEAVYVNEIKDIYWTLVIKEKPKVKIVSDEEMEDLENE